MSACPRHWITRVCDYVSPRAGDAIVVAIALAALAIVLWLGALWAA